MSGVPPEATLIADGPGSRKMRLSMCVRGMLNTSGTPERPRRIGVDARTGERDDAVTSAPSAPVS